MRVHIPSDGGPSPLALILVALPALLAGILVAWWASDDMPERRSERAPAPRVEPEQPEPEPAPEPRAPSSSLHVQRGRIAYLRCEPAACPRDEVMEQAVWAAIEALPACADPPPAAGEADVRVDYAGDAAPVVDWRDTFPDTTVRLDEARVIGCLREPIAATRKSVPAERLLVSFRFSMQ